MPRRAAAVGVMVTGWGGGHHVAAPAFGGALLGREGGDREE